MQILIDNDERSMKIEYERVIVNHVVTAFILSYVRTCAATVDSY